MKWVIFLIAMLWFGAAQAQPIQYPAMPSCIDTSGQHLNYNPATFLFSCGNSSNIASLTSNCPLTWASNQVVQNGIYPCFISSWTSTTITSMQYYTNGTGSPSFTMTPLINGTPVGTCNSISVSSTVTGTLGCTTPNTMGLGDQFSIQISGVAGNPLQADVQPIISHSP